MTSMNEPDITQLQIDVGIVKDKMAAVQRSQERVEKKLDEMSYVKVEDFDKFKEYVEKKFATKEEIKPLVKLFWTVIGAMAVLIVGAVGNLIIKR